MKSKQEKRKEALERLKASTYDNSKAKRLGTKDQEKWQAWKEKQIASYK